MRQQVMQFKKEERSIFPENFVEMQEITGQQGADNIKSTDDILSEIELLSTRAGRLSSHVLSRGSEIQDEAVTRNSISDLVKMGHRLPKVESVEKMLSSEECAKEAEMLHNDEGNFGIKPYRIVNLISGSYRLPEIDDDSFYR